MERTVWLQLEVSSRKEAHTARSCPFWRSIDNRRIALVMETFQSRAGLLFTLLCGVWTRGLMQSPLPFTKRGGGPLFTGWFFGERTSQAGSLLAQERISWMQG